MSAGYDTQVTAISSSQIIITFVGFSGSQNLPQMQVVAENLNAGARSTSARSPRKFRRIPRQRHHGQQPALAERLHGRLGELYRHLDQLRPGGDSPYQSSVFAKRFVANGALVQSNLGSGQSTSLPAENSNPLGAIPKEYVIWDGGPAGTVYSPNVPVGQMTGVAQLLVTNNDGSEDLGSGELLYDGLHILTAAHVVCNGTSMDQATNIAVTFVLPGGNLTFNCTQAYVLPGYDGTPWSNGHDLAIITLPQTARANPALPDQPHQQRHGPGLRLLRLRAGRAGLNRADDRPRFHSRLGGHALRREQVGNHFRDPRLLSRRVRLRGGRQRRRLGHPEEPIRHRRHLSGAAESISGKAIPAARTSSTASSMASPATAWPSRAARSSPASRAATAGWASNVNVSLYASWIDSICQSGGGEFKVNQGGGSSGDHCTHSTVSMDLSGDYVIAWNSYGQSGSGNGYGAGYGGMNGVYAQRYSSDDSEVGGNFLVNSTTAYNHQYPSIGMDAAGDFTIAWEGWQDKPLPPYTGNVNPDVPNSYGIYAQRLRPQLGDRHQRLSRPQRRARGPVRGQQHDRGQPAPPQRGDGR